MFLYSELSLAGHATGTVCTEQTLKQSVSSNYQSIHGVLSTALTSDDLDTQMAPVHISVVCSRLLAVLFIYGRTFYTCS